MQVLKVLIETILLEGKAASARATLYEFSEQTWVTVHASDHKVRFGPLGLIPNQQAKSSPLDLRERPVPTKEKDNDHLEIQYKDTWTVPESALVALLLPQHCVCRVIDVTMDGKRTEIETGVSPENQLFCYWMNSSAQTRECTVKAVFEKNAEKHATAIGKVDRIGLLEEGKMKFDQLPAVKETLALLLKKWPKP